MIEEPTTQQVDPYADKDIDEIMSIYAIAFRDKDFVLAAEAREEVLKRVRALRAIQYYLSDVKL